jgi:ADP-ribose pyrophosphatase YjhB (NUDIX family)
VAPVVTVDVVSIRRLENNAIGIAQYKRMNSPEMGKSALPGCYVYAGEKPAILAAGVLLERCDVAANRLRLVTTADATARDERGDSISLVYLETGSVADDSHLLAIPDAFDHGHIVENVMTYIKTNLAAKVMKEILQEPFIARDAYETFCSLVGEDVDRPNFLRSHRHLWNETGDYNKPTNGRPAKLHRWTA